MTNVSSFARRGALPIGLALLALTTLPASAQDLRQITYVQPSPSAINSYPVHVAIGEGYFADEGLEVIPQSVNGSSAILQALASGQAQFGRPGPAPVIQANARGEEVVFIYNSLPRSSFGILVQAEDRSEEHTSELQSLMRISYAVFCLKKKKKTQ